MDRTGRYERSDVGSNPAETTNMEGIWLDEEPLLKSGKTCNGFCGFESHFLLKVKDLKKEK